MKRLLYTLVAITIASAVGAAPIELSLGMNGRVRLGDTGAELGMAIHSEGWKSTATSACKDFKMPDAATGTAKFGLYDWNDYSHGDGNLSLLKLADGRALISASVTSLRDQKTEGIVLSCDFSIDKFAGGSWKCSNGKSGTFPQKWDGQTIVMHYGEVEWIEISEPSVGDGTPTLPQVGRDGVPPPSVRVSFAAPTHVLFQDSRKWHGAFTMRIYSRGVREFRKGDQRNFLCFVSAPDGVNVKIDQPVTVKAGEDWIPLDYRKDIEAGSALDFSKQGLQDAPAGKYGWLKNVSGHFEFADRPGKPQRFYGVNFCFDANYPDHEFADKLVTRLVRLGYNSVRIHHYERELVKGTKDNLGLDPVRIDKLDYLLAKCYAAGLYVTTDLFVSRPVPWKAIGIDRKGDVDMQVYKCLVQVYEPAYENWCAFAKTLMDHVNPYTGRAYRDEPGLPLISLINEGQMAWCWKDVNREPLMQQAWKDWLAERRKENAAKYKDVPDDPTQINPWDRGKEAFNEFRAFLERRTYAKQRDFLRSIGVKAMLTNQNCSGEEQPMMDVRKDLYDYVDSHFYVDHPQFLGQSWRLPSKCKNKNPALEKTLAPVACARTRQPGMPFTITEWNFSGPGMFRGVGGIMTGAVGARDGFDGLWRFAYSHNLYNMQDRQGFPGYFDTGTDPLGQAGDRASICLFLRGDLAAGDQKAMQVDKQRGSVALVTDRTAGGFVPSGSLTAGPVSFDVGDAPATVWASSLDNAQIAKSKRILVTHLTDVQADGNVYADEAKCVLLKWGNYPPVVRNGSAKISFSLENPATYSVWSLDTTGKRLEKLPTEIKDGKFCFTVSVKGASGASMLYEVAR